MMTLARFVSCQHPLVSPEGDGVGHVDVKLAQLPAPVPFGLHWHRRNDAHPAQRWLREQVALVCRELYGIGAAQ